MNWDKAFIVPIGKKILIKDYEKLKTARQTLEYENRTVVVVNPEVSKRRCYFFI